jgi:lipid-A-disaccharide synthase
MKNIKNIPHPLLKNLGSSGARRAPGDFKRSLSILLLPGSRNFEVASLLPEFLKAMDILKKEYPVRVSLVASENINENLILPYKKDVGRVYKSQDLPEALGRADFALSASGTVTLSCALMNVPTVVSYRVSPLNEFLYGIFVSYEGPFSLTNIVHEKMVFPELIQERATSFNMAASLKKWLEDPVKYRETLGHLAQTRDLLDGELKNPGSFMAGVIDA